MSKFNETIDKIACSEYDKNKMLRRILNHEAEKEQSLNKKFIPRLVTFFFAFIVLSGSCFALVKICHFDDKFKELFGKTDEELTNLGITPSEVQMEKEFKEAKITVTQTIMNEKELNILIDIVGKENTIYVEDFFLSSGKTFDESLIEKKTLSDGTISLYPTCKENTVYGCMSRGVSKLEETEKKTGYLLNISVNKNKKDTDEVTLRLFTNKGTYDLSFALTKNDLNIKEIKYKNVEILNEKGILVTVDAIRLSPFSIVVSMNYNKDIQAFTDTEMELLKDKVYNDSGKDSTYVTYKDGTKKILTLWCQMKEESMRSPYGTPNQKANELIDVESITSITIHGKTFAIK